VDRGASFTFNVAQRYANRAIDASLSQASRALARQVKPVAAACSSTFPRSRRTSSRPIRATACYYMVSTPPGQFILGNPMPAAAASVAPRLGEPYFYDGHDGRSPRRAKPASGCGWPRCSCSTATTSAAPDTCWCRWRAAANREELARPHPGRHRAAAVGADPADDHDRLGRHPRRPGAAGTAAPAGGRACPQRPGADPPGRGASGGARTGARHQRRCWPPCSTAWWRSAASSATRRTSCARRWPA
jgi:hypothetical protein